MSAGSEIIRKRARTELQGASAATITQIADIRDGLRIINPGQVQAILSAYPFLNSFRVVVQGSHFSTGDLSPLSEASLVTVLHLAREYQEALLPSVTGAQGSRLVLEAISMLEARIRTAALELVLQMKHLQGSISLLQDLLGENAELLSGPEVAGLRQLAGIADARAGPSDSSEGSAAIEEAPDAQMEEIAPAVASAPVSAANSVADSEGSNSSNKTI